MNHPSPIVALANQKGGVGKTTTAVNLAACLTARHQTVLLVDLDPQANATSGLGVEKAGGQSVYRALLGEQSLAEIIVPTDYKRLDLAPSELDLAGAEVDIARGDRYLHRLREALAPVAAAGRYDYILVDCPPSLGILTMNALAAADQLVVPLQCEYFALEGLAVIRQLVQRLRAGAINPALELEGVVLTMFDSRTNLARQVLADVQQHLGARVYRTVIPRSVRLSEAPSHGQPILAYDPQGAGALAYQALADEFLKRRRQPAPTPPGPPTEPEVAAVAPPATNAPPGGNEP